MYIVGGNLRERVHLEDLGRDGRQVLKCILKKSVGERVRHYSGSGKGQVACCCEHGDVPDVASGIIKCGELLEWVRNC